MPPLTGNARVTAAIGAAGLVLALFAPIMSVPILGSRHLFADPGSDWCCAIYLVGAISVFGIVTHSRAALLFAGAFMAVASAAFVVGFQFQKDHILEQASHARSGLADAIITAGMSAVQLEWGVAVLFIASGCLIASAFIGANPTIVGHAIGHALRNLFVFRSTPPPRT